MPVLTTTLMDCLLLPRHLNSGNGHWGMPLKPVFMLLQLLL